MMDEKAKNKYLLSKYGITYKDYVDTLNSQGNVCFICQRVPGTGRLCVDHIHVPKYKTLPPEEKKKHVRGILCFLCNTGLKGFEKTGDGARNRKQLTRTFLYFSQYRLKGEP